MKFLVIEQDLRVSGTSQGVISRSFLAKLRIAYPDATIDVVYLKQYASDDQLDLLPVNAIVEKVVNLKIPLWTLWRNKLHWRLFHVSLKERHIQKAYAAEIAKIDYKKYDHIFIRSAGLNHEILLASKDLPILKHAIVNFHEPFPFFWCSGGKKELATLELFRLKEMHEVVQQAKTCMATDLLAADMQFLYGSRKKFYSLPHQYVENVFDLSDKDQVIKKNKKVAISYHGAVQFGRNINILLDCYEALVNANEQYRENTEFVLRVKGVNLNELRIRYASTPNIIVLDCLNFSNSANEQIHETDITIILENGPLYCNILVGKAPFLAAYNKPVLSISPFRSELRGIIKDEKYIADCNNKEEIKQKLETLMSDRLNSEKEVYPFGDYFSDENFKQMLDLILYN
ncbi:hypothetical protein H8R23_08460 [Flavobacterium sp. F-380]|uniref:Glycosyltransferase family 4 protein n=1 Tax=Flavobacterium kayseriense TaxID=2764714 RepID=A0ABR7J7C3_9FLAO|nr:hypothetical protein [Flavobacterium kayseriense]MBC5841436.1 hypothetical protein [Flavobacterium kayseriense]MBC5847964.1 hypothetical protein [Flavobacterium kayseriense]